MSVFSSFPSSIHKFGKYLFTSQKRWSRNKGMDVENSKDEGGSCLQLHFWWKAIIISSISLMYILSTPASYSLPSGHRWYLANLVWDYMLWSFIIQIFRQTQLRLRFTANKKMTPHTHTQLSLNVMPYLYDVIYGW